MRSFFRVLILTIATGAVAVDAAATCTPSVSTVQLSDTVLEVTATAGASCGPTKFTVTVDGAPFVIGGCLNSANGCTAVWNLDTSCHRTGSHTIQVTGECMKEVSQPSGPPTCEADTPGTASTAFSVNTTPTVGIALGATYHTDGVISISYSFPNTRSEFQRSLELYLDGVKINGTAPGQRDGVWLATHPPFCWTTGSHELKAVAIACGGASDPAFRAEDDVTVQVDTHPVLSATSSMDTFGRATIDVQYEFPNTGNMYSARRITAYIDDVYWTELFWPQTISGVWQLTLDTSCWTPGSHDLKFIAEACGHFEETHTTLEVEHDPEVSLQLNPATNVVTVQYSFPQTRSEFQRRIEMFLDGAPWASASPQPQSGALQYTLPSCWKDFRAVATACGQFGNPEASDEDEIQNDPPKPTVKLTPLPLGLGATGRIFDVELVYDLRTGGGSVRVDLKSWIHADGTVQPGISGIVNLNPPPTPSGTHVFQITAPSGAQQLLLEATATTAACQVATADASIDCGSCPIGATVDPVYLSDGNVRVTDAEPLPSIAGQSLVRTYNSHEQMGALFGRGWTSLFERRLMVSGGGPSERVSLVTETNEVVTFRATEGVFRQTWPTARAAHGTLERDPVAGTYSHREAGSSEVAVFRASDGRLSSLRDLRNGREAQITYDGQGRPQALTDSWSGTSWILTMDGANRRVQTIAVSGRPDLVWTYAYDGAGNLVTVLAPGGAAWRTYQYSANRMTASYDALGNLIEAHTYDANGYGISSTGPSDEIASLEYNLPGSVAEERLTRVTYKTGAVAVYTLRPAGGAYRPVQISGGCASCGASDATYVYDAEGRIVREQNADGYVTLRTFGPNGPSSEHSFLKPVGCDPQTDVGHCRLNTDALAAVALEPTAPSVLSTLEQQDALWPDRTTAIERPSVRATGEVSRQEHLLHAASGTIVRTTTRGWTGETPVESERSTVTTLYGECGSGNCPTDDPHAPAFAPGGAFQSAWLSLPQPQWLAKSVDGPRLDAQDVTSFVYYPVDASVPALLRGQLAATRNAAGHIVRYEDYDVFGSATRVVDANGVATELTFDDLGRLATSTTKGVSGCNVGEDPLCATDLTTTRTYDPDAGPVRLEQRPGGGVTAYTYDTRGRVQTVSRGPAENDLRERLEMTYDPLTGLRSLERTLANESGTWVEKRRQSFAYDAHSRLQTLTHADGAAVHYTYDPDGRLATVRDENHTTPNTLYAYDPAGRLATVRQALTGAPGGLITTSYAYDTGGNLTAVTDPNGNTTSYVYDDFGQMEEQVSPVTGTTTYEYDDTGNLTGTTDANGATTERTHDSLGRVLSAVSSRSGLDTETVAWTYDDATAGQYGIGRLAAMQDPSGTTSYAYERRGLLRLELHDGTLMGASYLYDADGNRTMAGITEYTFDFAGRPVSGSSSGWPLFDGVHYLPFGPLTELTYGNGAVKTMTYDARYRPLRNKLVLSSTVIADYAYQHDPAGNITQIHDAVSAAYNRDFGYDGLNRLVTANTGAGLWGNGSYTYDPSGNMTALTLGTSRSLAFAYDGTTSRLSAVNGVPVSYDDAGNEAPNISARNLVAQDAAHYVYDGRGVRVLEYLNVLETSLPYSRTSFYLPELRLLTYVDSSIGPPKTTSIVWLGDMPVGQLSDDDVSGMILEGDLSHFRYTFTDHLGTPLLQMIGPDVVWRAEHEPYGAVHEYREGAAMQQRLRFPGQEATEDNDGTEKAYNIFRWYRSGWGRFTQADPIWHELVFKEFGSPFSYARNNPARYVDPDGLDVRVCCRPVNFPLISGNDHCYIESNTGGRRRTWGLHRREWGPNGSAVGVPQVNEPSDRGGVCESWKSDISCTLDKCLQQTYARYPVEPYSDVFANLGIGNGRNSNTFAKCLATKCGFSAGPGVVGDAPGWSQPCPGGL